VFHCYLLLIFVFKFIIIHHIHLVFWGTQDLFIRTLLKSRRALSLRCHERMANLFAFFFGTFFTCSLIVSVFLLSLSLSLSLSFSFNVYPLALMAFHFCSSITHVNVVLFSHIHKLIDCIYQVIKLNTDVVGGPETFFSF